MPTRRRACCVLGGTRVIFWTSDNGETQITLYQGHVLDMLRQLPSESVHCVVTSPPYYALRDYGLPPTVWGGDGECEHDWDQRGFCSRCGAWRGQLGLEPSPDLYVQHMVEVFREVRRVLRADGTLWLNLGDTYLSQYGSGFNGQRRFDEANLNIRLPRPAGVKPKDLIGIPWAVAFALRADGWYLRSDIIVAKANPMPESVKDRPTRAHEYVFLLAKRARYFYDADAIREPHEATSLERAKYGEAQRKESVTIPGRDKRWHANDVELNPLGRNKRSVWVIATEPFPEAHFATFPQRLVEPMILAGTSPKACPKCGAPWERVRVRTGFVGQREPAHVPNNTPTKTDSTGWQPAVTPTNEFRPTCSCPGNDGSGRCIVLDPFVGSGTTMLVAARLGRHAIGIDLNPDYLAMARRRIEAEHAQRRLPVGF